MAPKSLIQKKLRNLLIIKWINTIAQSKQKWK